MRIGATLVLALAALFGTALAKDLPPQAPLLSKEELQSKLNRGKSANKRNADKMAEKMRAKVAGDQPTLKTDGLANFKVPEDFKLDEEEMKRVKIMKEQLKAAKEKRQVGWKGGGGQSYQFADDQERGGGGGGRTVGLGREGRSAEPTALPSQ